MAGVVFQCFGLRSPLGVRTEQLNTHTHTHKVCSNVNTHNTTLTEGRVLHNAPHTHIHTLSNRGGS